MLCRPLHRTPIGATLAFALLVCLGGCDQRESSQPPPDSPPPPPGPAARSSRILSFTTLHRSAARPRFSPDGQSIVFDRLNADGFYDLYISSLQGTVTVSVTEGRPGVTQRNSGNGVYHPGGGFVVFVSEVASHFLDEVASTGDPGVGLFSNLWAFDLRTSSATQLTAIPIKRSLADPTPAMAAVNPVFSLDGNLLVWTERYAGGGNHNWGAWRLKAGDFGVDNGRPVLRNERVLFTPAAGNYVTAMAFIDANNLLVAGNLEGQHEYAMDQYVVNLQTLSFRNLTRTGDAWEEGACLAPNRTIAFMSNVDSRIRLDTSNADWAHAAVEREYYVTDESGASIERLTYFNEPGAPEYQGKRTIVAACSFSPDGAYMAGTVGSDRRTDSTSDIELTVVLFAFRTPLRPAAGTSVEPNPSQPEDDAAARPADGIRLLSASGSDLDVAASQVETLLHRGELDIVATQEDTMIPGRFHERLEQRHRGVPVFGGQIVRQIDGRRVLSVFGRVYDGIGLETIPRVPASAAEATAASGTATAQGGESVTTLGILPLGGGQFRLSYRVRIRTADDIRVAFVDAGSGAVLHAYSDVRSMEPTSTTRQSVLVPAPAERQPLRSAWPSQRVPFVADFRSDGARLSRFLLTGEFYPSDEADTALPAARGVLLQHQAVERYLLARCGRRGYDDAGGLMRVIMHSTGNDGAARYLGGGTALYGATPSDGSNTGLRLDVVAHETAHAVVEFSSMLSPVGEPAAVAEGFADIIAVGASTFVAARRPQIDTWMIGRDLTGKASGRSLARPSASGAFDHHLQVARAQPDDVRTRGGGIMGHVFYLAVAGGVHRVSEAHVTGVGLAKMAHIERIFYRAAVFFLGPDSGFVEAQRATDYAAVELYGSSSLERAAVGQAWSAVGIH